MVEKLLTVAEAADLLRVSHWTLRDWIRLGKGPRVTRIESRLRFTESDIARYIEERGAEPRAAVG